jgi:hypothetical protein
MMRKQPLNIIHRIGMTPFLATPETGPGSNRRGSITATVLHAC